MLPAFYSKHKPLLSTSFGLYLAQNDQGISNGTCLWLGGQVLAHYLAQTHARFRPPASFVPRAIELGSGIGMTALALSSLGWNVLATDLQPVIDTVLRNNIATNLHRLPEGSGQIDVRELDWFAKPDQWHWDNPLSVTSPPTDPTPDLALQPPFDLILSADTVYTHELIAPLLRVIHALSTASHALSHRYPFALVCVERRDPSVLDAFLAEARSTWNFSVERIPRTKLAKSLEKGGLNWDSSDWDGVEIWKLRLK